MVNVCESIAKLINYQAFVHVYTNMQLIDTLSKEENNKTCVI